MAVNTLQPARGDPGSWRHETIDADAPMSQEMLRRALVGEIPGIRIPGVIGPEVCETVLGNLVAFSKQRAAYAGGLNIGSALADGVDENAKAVKSHWELRYMNAMTWEEYGARKPGWESRRESLTKGVAPDLLCIVQHRLQAAWPGEVTRARHPVTGQELYAGILRPGAPKLHADWAADDIRGMPAVHQIGISIYIRNQGPGGDLRVFRTLVAGPGNTANSGLVPVGNYDLPYSIVDGAEYDVIPVNAGDMIIAPNRYLHDVTPCPDESLRMAFGVHAVMLLDGTLALFS